MTYIIAEIGVNHSGCMITAKKMIDVAKDCGADCVKFQLYELHTLAHQARQFELYQQFHHLRLAPYELFDLKEYCDKIGIDFLCTPDDLQSAVFLDKIQDKFKISSVGAANLHLLRLINTFKKPVYISNGLVNNDGVAIANKLLKDCDVTWMECVSQYPALKEDYYYCTHYDGLSDHTIGIDLAIEAAQRGAIVIEKHFTLDKTQEGFDHHMSADPKEFKQMVEAIREVK